MIRSYLSLDQHPALITSMAVSLAEINLDRHEPHPPRFRTSPTPKEAITQIYADHHLAQFYPDAQPTLFHPEINRNVHQALVDIARTVKTQRGTVGTIEGCMAAGKTSLIEHLALTFPQAQVFKHAIDTGRFSGNALWTQSDGGRQTLVTAKTYTTVADLLDQVRLSPKGVVIVDEFHFAADADNYLGQLVNQARQSDTKLIFAGLNFDFARRPWSNALLVKDCADLFSVVLAARCSKDSCHAPALFTTRRVTLPDGRTRPAHTDEPIVQVGQVANAYFPACAHHHQVMRPNDAHFFDAGHEPDDYVFPGKEAATTFWYRPRR